jgi:hypothetical protein
MVADRRCAKELFRAVGRAPEGQVPARCISMPVGIPAKAACVRIGFSQAIADW